MSEKRLTVDIPENLHRRLKIRCAELGIDMKEALCRLIEQFLGESRAKAKKP